MTRRDIAAYAKRSPRICAPKHIDCIGEQIVVTSGTQQALDIVNRLMLDPESAVWLEEPDSLAARAAFSTTSIFATMGKRRLGVRKLRDVIAELAWSARQPV